MALHVHSREELGMDPDEQPSPLQAGTATLLAYSSGALAYLSACRYWP